MKLVLLRVGIDTGSGGIHGQLFRDSTLEFIPIPDGSHTDPRTYGNTNDRSHGRLLVDYFPGPRRKEMANQSMHVDPEFDMFTYGDPTSPKARLRTLAKEDILAFYSGLEGWDFSSAPALYIVGYFEVAKAGLAREMGENNVKTNFSSNFHVRHSRIRSKDWNSLVLVKGDRKSRLLSEPVLISTTGQDRIGKPLKVLSKEMRRIFGDFEGRISIQRSPPRWVSQELVGGAADFVRSLE